MKQQHRSAIAASLAVLALSGAQALTTTTTTTTPATSVPAEVTAAQAVVVKDINTVKLALTRFDVDKAAAKDTTADLAALQVARQQLKTDQVALEAVTKSFLAADKAAVQADQAQLRVDIAAALNSSVINADKAALSAAEAKLKADLAAGNTAAIAADKAAVDADRKSLAGDRAAAIAGSAAVAADKAALAAARLALKTDRAAVFGQVAVAERAAGLTRRDLHASMEGMEHGEAKGATHVAMAGGLGKGEGHGDHGSGKK